MHKIFLKMILIGFLFVSNFALAAESSPVPMLESTADNIISTLNKNKESLKSDPQIVNKAITAYLLPHVDIQGMTRSVLGRQTWMKMSNDERKDFTLAFTKLVVRTYAVPLAEYSGETVRFIPIRGEINSRFIQVKSIISRTNGQKIPLNYSLVAKKEGWMIYDLSVDGVSLLQSYRIQFNNSLQTVSVRQLIKQMNEPKKAA